MKISQRRPTVADWIFRTGSHRTRMGPNGSVHPASPKRRKTQHRFALRHWPYMVASDGEGERHVVDAPTGWEHVSVQVEPATRTPTWDEMAWVKQLFWEPEVRDRVSPAGLSIRAGQPLAPASLAASARDDSDAFGIDGSARLLKVAGWGGHHAPVAAYSLLPYSYALIMGARFKRTTFDLKK